MSTNLVELFSKSLAAPKTTAAAVKAYSGSNPFGNPFMNARFSEDTYMKNSPIRGGYFAGYYNGKANIVGQKLFIEA
ncbi:MAG: hypothetical protein DKM22_05005 [Candidatus Melainabacteria bacterium]|nr:MAG: hypothetical protein DKM22_05005 [Candidatus Melainabacteria bacterium]